MTRVTEALARCKSENRAALIPFITAGDPHPDHTVSLMHALVEGGADIIELGLPFSDPMADGPTIQLACERALAAGSTRAKALAMVREFRQSDSVTPVVLMGYLNPMMRQGPESFAKQVKDAGVDGVLAVDLSIEESETLQPALAAENLDCIFLVAPTTSLERARRMGEVGSGYLYYVSLKGVTGSAALDVAAVDARLKELRTVVDLPIAVGFGIRTADHARKIGAVAEGVVVGSALVERIADGAARPESLPPILRDAVAELRSGIVGKTDGGKE